MRLYGAVTPVKDQSVCGSCWSFGTVGTLEGALFLNTGQLTRLSQQALVDCSWGFGNNGCDGGEDWRAYQWMIRHGGIPTEVSIVTQIRHYGTLVICRQMTCSGTSPNPVLNTKTLNQKFECLNMDDFYRVLISLRYRLPF